jgi:hypothetical protein
VEIVTHYSNTPDLLVDLRRTVQAVGETDQNDEPDLPPHPADRPWHVRDRLSTVDIDQLVESYKAGTTIPQLATQYGICWSSVKRLLKEHAVRRRPRRKSSP